MTVFVDTSAFLALINANDLWAHQAAAAWKQAVLRHDALVTTAYVVVETSAILQRRVGMDAVRLFADRILPILDVVPIDRQLHESAFRAMLASNRRDLSLVDCCSFECMRRRGISTAFAFDPHFAEQGFDMLAKGHEMR